VATIIQSVKIENAWGHLNFDEEFLSDEEAHKLAVSDSFYYNNNNGQLLQLPLDALELSPELFVNILYGKNGTGKSTFLKIIDDGIELVNGLVKQYIVQNNTPLSEEDARSWKEGDLPLRTVMKGHSRKIKSTSFAKNLFVQNLLQSHNKIYAEYIKSAQEHGHMDTKRKGFFPTEGKAAQTPWWRNNTDKHEEEFLFKIKGYHTPEDHGTAYSFEISFERLDLRCFSKHLIANDRISNIGNAGYVVKCDVEPSETRYKLELSEDPLSKQTYMLSNDEHADRDEGLLPYQHWQEKSCIPFIINDEHEIITLGNHSINWDNDYTPRSPFYQKKDRVHITAMNHFLTGKHWQEMDDQYRDDDIYFKAIEKKKPENRTEKELDDWNEFFWKYNNERITYWLTSQEFGAGSYFFLNPTKTPPNLQEYMLGITGSSRTDISFEYGYDDPDGFDFESHEKATDSVVFLKEIGKGLSSEYSFSLNSKPNEISPPLFEGPKRKIRSKQIYDSKMYTSLRSMVNELTNNSPNIESLPETLIFYKKINSDSKEALNEAIIEFFNYLNESTLGTIIKSISVKYMRRYYGFEKSISVKQSEEYFIDDIRNRLEFLWSEGISRLVYHNRYETACNCLEEFTGLIMKNPGKKVFSSKYLKRKNTGASVKYEHLSSGERSIFNLISILASTEQKGPVFIDEPELSLHPAWQLEFNDLVVELVKHSRRQVFFASHSPDIVMPLISRAFPVEQSEGEH
jgi:predicted ATPase